MTAKPPSGTTLLLIDEQKDFHPGGSLAIPTAGDDARRVADLIQRSLQKDQPGFDRLVATLDSHHKLHIANPKFWVSSTGESPAPFTIITSDEIKAGKWKPRPDLKLPVDRENIDDQVTALKRTANGDLDLQSWAIHYTKSLEDAGRFKLCIWPEHCLIGTNGHAIEDNINDAMQEWSGYTGNRVDYVPKGENILTEMYSVMKAEIPVTSDTDFNGTLLKLLKQSKNLIVVGQAMSHCVNYTVRDIVSKWKADECKNIYILTDCMSPVGGFEKDAQDFAEFCKVNGLTLCSSTDVLDKIA